MFEAMQKETARIEAEVVCPECLGSAEAAFSAKKSVVRVDCRNCGKVREKIIQYGAGAVIGDTDNSDQ